MMGMDRWAYLSRLRYVDPIPKLCLTGTAALCCLCLGGVGVGLATAVLMAALTAALGGISPRVLLRAFRVPLAFLVLGCLTVALDHQPVGSPMVVSVAVGGSLWGLSSASLLLAAQVFCRALGVVGAVYFLAFTTPMTDLCLALERIHVPRLFVELMELIYRFIFVLSDGAARIRVAQASRLGYASPRRGLESAGTLAALVFLRAWKRGERVYAALESRGYEGRLATLPVNYRRGLALYGLAAGVAAVQGLIFWMERGVMG